MENLELYENIYRRYNINNINQAFQRVFSNDPKGVHFQKWAQKHAPYVREFYMQLLNQNEFACNFVSYIDFVKVIYVCGVDFILKKEQEICPYHGYSKEVYNVGNQEQEESFLQEEHQEFSENIDDVFTDENINKNIDDLLNDLGLDGNAGDKF
jgi:hypothetical protein